MSINYYRHHLGDYSKNTQQLTLTQHGAYRLLLDYYYTNEGPFPQDRQLIYRICRCKNQHDRAAVDYVLSKYFQPLCGVWCHGRADEEIKKYNEISEERRKAGAIAHANAEQKHLQLQHKPVANSHKPIASKLAISNGHDDETWDEEVLPSRWYDVAEQKGIPDEQIYRSWRRFKDATGAPFRFSRWTAWVENERTN